jgi:hypothetical protein
MSTRECRPRRKHAVGPRHHSDIRELRIPDAIAGGYHLGMAGTRGGPNEGITAARLARVAAFIETRCTKDQPESWHVKESGIPQSTFSSAKRGVKLGWATARRLAEYFGWGGDVDGFLDGTPPAGTWSALEEGLPMGYPVRGKVLDRFRGIVPDEVLREVQAIELEPGQELDALGWAEVLIATAKRAKALGKYHGQTKDRRADDSGQFPQVARRLKK